jgi:hypothetical protein
MWQSRGTAVLANAETCEPYRRGLLKAQQLATYYEPAFIDPNAYRWTEIQFREEYLPKMFRGSGFSLPEQRDTPNISRYFEIGLDGQPLPKPPEELWRAADDLYFRLLISGLAFHRTPERMIGVLSSSRSYLAQVQAGHMESGFYVEKPTRFERSGVFFQGFERITVPDGQDWATKDRELFIHTAANGETDGVLRCSSVGVFPSPQCSLYEEIGPFEANIGFRRTLMPQIQTLLHHMRAFVSCLTMRGTSP